MHRLVQTLTSPCGGEDLPPQDFLQHEFARLKLPASQRLLSGMTRVQRTLLLLFLLLAVPLFVTAQNPVVVELFTSEGCSSCPPADAVLMKLSQQGGSNVVLLGEHVDYWNYIGWTDRFSSSQFSQRQSEYGKALHSSTYTPQMVIDGKVQFVGNDVGEVERRIAEAAKDPKPVPVKLRWEGNGRLHVSVQLPVRGIVLLAVTEDGLNTSVNAGENGGQTLHHAAVVRQLREVVHSGTGGFDGVLEVKARPDWNQEKLKVAVVVQEEGTLRVLGAAEVAYAH
jgi:hypothetical protein